MADQRIEKLAQVCVHYCVDLKPKEKVLIQGSGLAFPLINELYKECLTSDAYPLIQPKLDVEGTFFKYAKKHQLTYVSPFTMFLVENMDVTINISSNPTCGRLTNIDPSKIQMNAASKRELVETFMKRSAEGKLRSTILPFPINAQAQAASMALSEYEDFVYSSCLVDNKDPIAEWKKIHEQQEKICEFLNQVNEIHIRGEDTDLAFNVKGRKWENCDGKSNMPDGEVFTAPIENSANGTIKFTFPIIYFGSEIEDIELKLREGRVVEASATTGDEMLQRILKIEGADRIGESAIGTNYGITKFTKSMLFDEKMGGTIHIALGASPPEVGGLNKSAIHLDILKDMRKGGEIYADGKLFYKNGKFMI